MNVIVVGTGYVGLPTAAVLSYLGHKVTCLDVNQEKITKLQQGKIPIYEPCLSELMTLSTANLSFTCSYKETDIEDCDVVFITFGTPTRKEGNADLSYLKAAAESIGKRLGHHFTVGEIKPPSRLVQEIGLEPFCEKPTSAVKAINQRKILQ